MATKLARALAICCLLLAGATGGCGWRAAEEQAFCYRWLTDVTCYAEPVPGAEARLVGGHFVDPDDPSSRAHWLRRARMSR